MNITALKCKSQMLGNSVHTNLNGLGGGRNGVDTSSGAWSRKSSSSWDDDGEE